MLALALLKDPSYRAYWLALFISQLGNWMQTAAQAWLVIELTGKAAPLGLVVACQFLPSLFLSIPAGVLADRYSKRNLMFGIQVIMALTSLSMAVLSFFSHLTFNELVFFALVSGITTALDVPVRQAFTVEVAGKKRYPGAISLNSFAFNTSRLLGPALAGLIVARWGVSYAFLINILTFFPFLLMLFRLTSTPPTPSAGSLMSQFLAGPQYVWNELLVRRIILMVGLTSLLAMNFQTLVPAYSRLVLDLDAKGYGLLMSSVGLGAMAGALWQALTGEARPPRVLLGASLLSITLGLLSLKLTLTLSTIVLAIAGFAMITTLLSANTSVQMLVPDQLRGRVMAIYSLVFLGTNPAGSYFTGLLFDSLGGRQTVLILGIATLIITLWMSSQPWPKSINRPNT